MNQISNTTQKGARIRFFSWGVIIGLLIFYGCGGGSSGGGGNPPVVPAAANLSGQAVLGPLAGATVEVYAADVLDFPVYVTTADATNTLAAAGTFDIPDNLLDDGTLYVIAVSNGEDIDENDDGSIDPPIPNYGVVHLVATGADLKQGNFRVNILSELAYFQAAHLIMTRSAADDILAVLNRTAGLLLLDGAAGDLNGDGTVNYADLMYFDPTLTTGNRAALRQGWTALGPYITALRSGDSYAAETGVKLTGILGSSNAAGQAYNVALSDDSTVAYVADGFNGLQPVNVSDPFAPAGGTAVPTGGASYDVAVSGDQAFVASGSAGLRAFDITAPDTPIIDPNGVTIADATAYGVAVLGNYAFVSYDRDFPGTATLQVVDTTTMTAAALPLDFAAGEGYDVAIDGDYAYVANGSAGLQVVDISSPGSPSLKGTRSTPGIARGIALSADGDYALVAADFGGLQVIGVSDPENPAAPIAFALPGSAYGIRVAGNRAYVACDFAGIQVLDITDPENPAFLGYYDTPGLAWGVHVRDGLAYVADFLQGLQIIDVGVPVKNAAAGFVRVPSEAYSVAVAGNYAYVGEIDALLNTIDVSDRSAPMETPSRLGIGSKSNAVHISNGTVFVANATASGLDLFDISTTPDSPSPLDSLPTPDFTVDVAVAGDYAYLAEQPIGSGITVVNVSDTSDINTEGPTEPTPGFAYGVAVAGNYLYIADGELGGLQVMDLTTKTIVGSESLVDGIAPAVAHGIAVSGQYAYIAAYNEGLQIINISNPTAPDWVSALDTPGLAERVAVDGNYAYVADTDGGVRVFDVSDPEMPVAVGYFDTPGAAVDVAVAGGYVYVADRVGGLQIYPAY